MFIHLKMYVLHLYKFHLLLLPNDVHIVCSGYLKCQRKLFNALQTL